MFGRLLKGFVVAAGVGFAIGMAAAKRRPEENRRSKHSAEEVLTPERFDRIESRIAAAESRAAEAELDLRTRAHAKDLEAVRLQVNEYRQRISSDVAVIQKGLADIAKSAPALLESIIAPRIDDLRLHVQSETQQSVTASLATFERAIEERFSNRMAALEKVILDQSVLVTALSHRAIESDMNLERLISTLSRLYDRTNESPESTRAASVAGLAA